MLVRGNGETVDDDLVLMADKDDAPDDMLRYEQFDWNLIHRLQEGLCSSH